MVSCASARGYALGLTSAMVVCRKTDVRDREGGEAQCLELLLSRVVQVTEGSRRFGLESRKRVSEPRGTYVKLHCLLLAQLRGD